MITEWITSGDQAFFLQKYFPATKILRIYYIFGFLKLKTVFFDDLLFVKLIQADNQEVKESL